MNKPIQEANAMCRILIVDDEPDLVRLMTRILAKAGYEPQGVSESKEALRLFEDDGGFAVVISDFMMPGLDGLALTDRVRHLRPHIPVILVTGTAHQMTDQEAKSHGVRQVLRKPFLPGELRDAVQSVLA